MASFFIEYRIVLGFICGLLVSLITIPPLIRVAKEKKLVAVPNGRTSHDGEVPSLGGVAIFAGVVLGSSLFIDNTGFIGYRFVFASMIIIFFIGLKDDLVDIGWIKKLSAEIIASLLVIVFADIRIGSFYGVFGIGTLPEWLSIAFTTFVFIALINCFNLLDGIDGLASGLGIIISLIFGIWLYRLGYTDFTVLAFSLAGGLASFYIFNVFGSSQKLFMGDTGSLLLGFLMAVLASKVMNNELPPSDPLYMKSLPTVVMGAMIIPIIDSIRVFAWRIVRRKNPFGADKTHLHHRLLDLGFSHLTASLLVIALNVAFLGLALIMRNMNPTISVLILFATALTACMIPFCFKLRTKTNSNLMAEPLEK